jgi:hypothetical protein
VLPADAVARSRRGQSLHRAPSMNPLLAPQTPPSPGASRPRVQSVQTADRKGAASPVPPLTGFMNPLYRHSRGVARPMSPGVPYRGMSSDSGSDSPRPLPSINSV